MRQWITKFMIYSLPPTLVSSSSSSNIRNNRDIRKIFGDLNKNPHKYNTYKNKEIKIEAKKRKIRLTYERKYSNGVVKRYNKTDDRLRKEIESYDKKKKKEKSIKNEKK